MSPPAGFFQLAPDGTEHLEQAGVTWFDANWAFIGPFVSMLCLLPLRGSTTDSLTLLCSLAWLIFPIYALHQFGEHGFDWFGRRYMFCEYANMVGAAAGMPRMTPRIIMYINVPVTPPAIMFGH